jgi:DNA (cytosine-5)-methyltransferase 1
VDTCAEYNVLSICSGYGGLELGLDAALDGRTRTVCYIENEIGVASILASCMENGTLDKAPIWSDLRTFDPEPWRGRIHLQPFSFAGKRLQSADERNLWPDVARIIDGIKPDRVFMENVPGIIRYYYDNIRPSLQEMGYTVKEKLFTAAETGAPHKRQRLFILAYTAGSQLAEAVDDTEGPRRRVHDTPHEGTAHRDVHTSANASDNELADTECLGFKRPEPQERPRCEKELPSRNRNELADTDSWGRTPLVNAGGCTETTRRGQAHAESGGGGEELADTDNGASIQCELEEGSGYDIRDDSQLADTAAEGLEGIRSEEQAQRNTRPETLPLYPPGPGDHEGWQWLIERWPELAPTVCKEGHDVQSEVSEVKSQIRSSPDGASAEFPNEVMLRAIGNGIVPLVAAFAWCELSKDAQ